MPQPIKRGAIALSPMLWRTYNAQLQLGYDGASANIISFKLELHHLPLFYMSAPLDILPTWLVCVLKDVFTSSPCSSAPLAGGPKCSGPPQAFWSF